MVFSSILFLFYFLPIVTALYFVVPKRFRNLVLFASSLLFYAWGEPVYVVIMIFSTLVDFIHGKIVHCAKENGNIKKAKRAVLSSMIINLFVLCFFKYSDFIIANINGLFATAIPLLELPLPIGISFYTFQTMSYTIDVYRGDAKVQNNIISFGAYVALFPQLIAGPIVRYKTIADQLNERYENFDGFAQGTKRFLIGLGKKVLIANNVGLVWNTVNAMDITTVPVLTAWLGIIGFTLQIYFDFSGYSDMAIGLGKIFGFDFLENFDYPYMSRSITEFWRRWHISLGTWFKEYVYIPLGGNKNGFVSHMRNIMIVWFLTGIWHGASWNFIAWGVYFGVLLIVEKQFLLKLLKKLPAFVSHIYTLFLVIISWALFAPNSLPEGLSIIKAMFGGFGAGFYDAQSLYILSANVLLFAIAIVASTNKPTLWWGKFETMIQAKPVLYNTIVNAFLLVILIISLAYLVDASYNPFLYFRF